MHFFFSREKTLSFEFLSNGFGWRWYKRLRNTSPVRLTSSQSENSIDIYLCIRTMELLEHRAEHSILSPIAAFLRLFSTGWIISVSIGFFLLLLSFFHVMRWSLSLLRSRVFAETPLRLVIIVIAWAIIFCGWMWGTIFFSTGDCCDSRWHMRLMALGKTTESGRILNDNGIGVVTE